MTGTGQLLGLMRRCSRAGERCVKPPTRDGDRNQRKR